MINTVFGYIISLITSHARQDVTRRYTLHLRLVSYVGGLTITPTLTLLFCLYLAACKDIHMHIAYRQSHRCNLCKQ